MKWMTCGWVGLSEGRLSLGAPTMHNMYGLTWAMHVYVAWGQLRRSSHSCIVLSCKCVMWLHALMSV